MFSSKRVFYLASGGLTVYQWRDGVLAEPASFATDDRGLAQFAHHLEREPRVPSYMLVDVVEEEFREDTIPHVFGGDRRALVRNKQNRLFRDARYSTALFQGRESGGRRDDRVLFTALIRPDILSPWLAQITRQKVPLAGIYSVPLISESLLKKLPGTSDHLLLVTLQSAGGLRQTFFHQGRLKISRLATLAHGDEGVHAPSVLSEIERIRRYLNSLRVLPRDNPLDVYILCRGDILAELRRQAVDTTTTRHHIVDTGDVARKLGLKDPLDSPYAEVLFARLLAKEAPKAHYGGADETRYHRMHRARVGMWAASVLILVASLAWSGYMGIKGVLVAQQSTILEQQTAFYTQRYEAARQGLPQTPVHPRQLQKAVEVVDELERYKASPLPVLATLSQALRGFDNLEIESVEWRVAADGGTGGQQGASVRRPERGAESGGWHHVALVSGYMTGFEGNYGEALDLVNTFADMLSELPGVRSVEITERPLEISPERSLTGSIGAGPGGQNPKFGVRVLLEGHPDGSA